MAIAVLPTLLVIWCCLSILQERTSDIPPVVTLVSTIGIALAGLWTSQLIFCLVCRDRELGSLITLVVASFVGLHGPVSAIFTTEYLALDKSWFFSGWLVVHVTAVAGLFIFARKKMLVHRVATSIAIALGLLVTLQTINVVRPVVEDSLQIEELDQVVDSESPIDLEKPLIEVDGPTPPDIYYLIPDAYARQDVLSEVYGFDNSDFIELLKSRGFYVGDESRSNYNYTEYSLASSLNMRYLQEFDLDSYQTRLPLRHLIRHSTVGKALKRAGYETYAIETGKSETECDNFDHYESFGKALNDYQDVLYHATPLPQLLDWTGLGRSAARRHGDRVLFALDQVPTLAKKNSAPAFVFCHLLAPHPPFLFDAEGADVDFHGHYLLSDCINFTSCYDYDLDVYRKGYREQLAYLNSQLIEMIDRIQALDRPSVIILQADHGPRLGFGLKDGESAAPWRYREVFSVLNAIAMPSGRKPEFYPTMTPVNTFRLIFNELFETQMPIQPDESYAVRSYSFLQVTDEAMPQKTATKKLASNISGLVPTDVEGSQK